MNKETFLRELREYLKVLEDQEQEDILAEYAQHIDMKMQKGLSEEEAIKDFGSMQELAAEILEAYHVKPEFWQNEKRRPFLSMAKRNSEKEGHKDAHLLKERVNKIKEKLRQGLCAIGRGFRWAGEKCRAFGRWLMKPFWKKGNCCGSGEVQEGDARPKVKQTKEVRGEVRGFFKALGEGINFLWKMFISFCIWCIRLSWNIAWTLFALFCAFFCMAALMGFGMLLILIFQGYPVAGILLICIGGLLCMGALTCGAFSLIIRKGKDTADTGIAVQEETKAFAGEVERA